MSQGCQNSSGTITPSLTLDQTHTAMRAIALSIKNASDARSHLYTKGWTMPGEEITLESLAKTLFAAVAHNPKITPSLANPILAIAYLINERIEDGVSLNITSSITKCLLDAIIPITTDIQTRLDEHLEAVSNINESQSDLTSKLLVTQEKISETNDKVTSNAKTYSQVATTPAPPNNALQPPSTTTYAQLRIQNREIIKRRQVLISFTHTPELSLDAYDETTLSRKALNSLNTTWASALTPNPPTPNSNQPRSYARVVFYSS